MVIPTVTPTYTQVCLVSMTRPYFPQNPGKKGTPRGVNVSDHCLDQRADFLLVFFMVTREVDCGGKRIPTYPISCLSVVQRVCWVLIRMASLYLGHLRDIADRIQVQSVGNVEHLSVDLTCLKSAWSPECRVRSPTGRCRSMVLVPLMLVLRLTLEKTK